LIRLSVALLVLAALPVFGGGRAQAGYVSLDTLNEPTASPSSDLDVVDPVGLVGGQLLTASCYWMSAAEDSKPSDPAAPDSGVRYRLSLLIINAAPPPTRAPNPVPPGRLSGPQDGSLAEAYPPPPSGGEWLPLPAPTGRPSRPASNLFRPPRADARA
jgi:hypothetical protein